VVNFAHAAKSGKEDVVRSSGGDFTEEEVRTIARYALIALFGGFRYLDNTSKFVWPRGLDNWSVVSLAFWANGVELPDSTGEWTTDVAFLAGVHEVLRFLPLGDPVDIVIPAVEGCGPEDNDATIMMASM
jgi:hypothetical protein